MVRETLAADEIAPTDDANIVTTGFLARNFYRWKYHSCMKDNVEHTRKAFFRLTFNCAQGHDHKYDPIRHEDYFAFRAYFGPLELRQERRPGRRSRPACPSTWAADRSGSSRSHCPQSPRTPG